MKSPDSDDLAKEAKPYPNMLQVSLKFHWDTVAFYSHRIKAVCAVAKLDHSTFRIAYRQIIMRRQIFKRLVIKIW